jgi:hypothetical protein
MGTRAVFAVTDPEELEGSLAVAVVASPPAGFEGCEHPESKKISEDKRMAAVNAVAIHVLAKGSMPSSPKFKCYTDPRLETSTFRSALTLCRSYFPFWNPAGRPRHSRCLRMSAGFYKRGCQEKTFIPSLEKR